jgi:hypothetical protein
MAWFAPFIKEYRKGVAAKKDGFTGRIRFYDGLTTSSFGKNFGAYIRAIRSF